MRCRWRRAAADRPASGGSAAAKAGQCELRWQAERQGLRVSQQLRSKGSLPENWLPENWLPEKPTVTCYRQQPTLVAAARTSKDEQAWEGEKRAFSSPANRFVVAATSFAREGKGDRALADANVRTVDSPNIRTTVGARWSSFRNPTLHAIAVDAEPDPPAIGSWRGLRLGATNDTEAVATEDCAGRVSQCAGTRANGQTRCSDQTTGVALCRSRSWSRSRGGRRGRSWSRPHRTTGNQKRRHNETLSRIADANPACARLIDRASQRHVCSGLDINDAIGGNIRSAINSL